MSMTLLPPLRKVPQPAGAPKLEASTLMIKDVRELFGQLSQEQNKIQELLSSLGYALRSFSNLHQFLELIPLIASRVNDADGAILIVFKPNGQVNLESLHCSDYAANGLAVVKPQQLRRTLEQEIQHVLASSIEILDQLVNRALGIGANVFSTPILVKNFVQGRLYVFSHKPDYAWNPNRQQLIRLVADQAAVGIENNALAAELLKKERQDRELEIGAEIQSQLLPRQCPTIQGAKLAAKCLTADRVGGDYYDFIPVSKSVALPQDRRWSIVIGDVMGKGVPAGLIMTMTRGMLRAEVLNGHSPSKILEHLNQIMYDDLEKSHRFVTMFYSEYDPKTQILFYSNAAHLPALLWRSRTQTIHSLDTLGALIGLEAGSIYDQNHVQLYPGDIVIYYTDGFTEAANTMGDRFDEENLRLYLQKACQKYAKNSDRNCPQGILDFIYDGVQSFIGQGRSHSDDMTLIVMQIEKIDQNQN